ncbi:MAG: methylated-DNA--[protein]-cysteine S-methyltransferase [Chitinophagaceae bacterium]|nr:methylated-DNA--[protein]-cysteine S-methyltransferase [Chitinophagaceae bacterium]
MKSPLGDLQITTYKQSLISLHFLDSQDALPIICGYGKLVIDQLKEYFDGERQHFELNLNPKGTSFQRIIWDLLCKIDYGTTLSYAALAKQYGDIKAIRAIGTTNGKNPIAIIIPCHRVIGSDGSLTGYAGGLDRKRWLLNHEARLSGLTLF